MDDVYEMDFLPDEQAEFMLQPGDLLLCEGGEIGRSAVWKGQIEECYFQKALHRARLKDSKSSPRFLMHFMAWAAKNGAISELRTGSAIPHLTGIKLKTLDVIWPEPTVQKQVVAVLDNIQRDTTEIQTIQSENAALLNQMEQSILVQAFRGSCRAFGSRGRESQERKREGAQSTRITYHASLLETEVDLVQVVMRQRTKAITLPKPQMDDIIGLYSATANPELPMR